MIPNTPVRRSLGEGGKHQAPNSKLIVALDVDSLKRAQTLVAELKDIVKVFKIGNQLFTAFGPEAIDMVHKEGCQVFLDLKFHDIPRTAAASAKEAVKLGVFMFNLHCLGGFDMLKAAADEAALQAQRLSREKPIILGVTILTSLSQDDLDNIGIGKNLEDQVIYLAELARDAGLDGVVASGKDVNSIKAKLNNDFIVACPGVRPKDADTQDQKRVISIDEAITKKADFIVVGRPITGADKPDEVAKWISKQLED